MHIRGARCFDGSEKALTNRLWVRVRSTDLVLDWIAKSEANYICENHFRPPGSDRMHGERERR